MTPESEDSSNQKKISDNLKKKIFKDANLNDVTSMSKKQKNEKEAQKKLGGLVKDPLMVNKKLPAYHFQSEKEKELYEFEQFKAYQRSQQSKAKEA